MQQFLLTELSLLSPEDISALDRLLSLAEQILSWDFSHYHILLVFSVCLLAEVIDQWPPLIVQHKIREGKYCTVDIHCTGYMFLCVVECQEQVKKIDAKIST